MEGPPGKLPKTGQAKARPRPAVRLGQRLARLAKGAGIAILCLLGLALLRIWDPAPVESVRVRTFDIYQNISPRISRIQPTVIVNIDERSLAEIGQWPWPRTIIARLTQALLKSGARVVAYDFVFAETDRTSPGKLVDWLPTLPADAARTLRQLPTNEEVLARAIRGTPVVLGQAVSEEASPAFVRKGQGAGIALLGGDPRPYLNDYPGMVRNLPDIEAAAAGRGVFSMTAESDSIVRRVASIFKVNNQLQTGIVLEILRVATGGQSIVVRTDAAGISWVGVAGRRVSTDNQGRIWIHFSPPSPSRYISAADVLAGRIDAQRIAGKIALIGTSATALRDLRSTPVAAVVPGVEIQAQALENIIFGTNLTRPNYALGLEIILLLTLGLVIIVLVPRLSAAPTLVIGVLMIAALFAGSWYAFTAHHLLLDATYSAFSGSVIYLFLTLSNYLRGESERRRIRVAFSRYVSPELVSRLAENHDQLKLGGEQKEMTILFSDVHGFTGISELYGAVELTSLINRMFTPLTRAILEHRGTVDKYMGDSIMAFWNAPLDDPDHARHACLAALEMSRRIPLLNADLKAEAEARGTRYVPINLGIGLNSGDCCVGNLGSDLRFDYSVIGDTVNTASRLEGQTRTYKVANVIGESTRHLAGEMAFLELDLVMVVGKTAPVRIYTILGDRAIAESDDFRTLAAAHDEMLRNYRNQNWDGALAAIGRCRELQGSFSLNGLYDMYEGRIAHFRANPPGKGWNAVFEAKSKG